MTSKINDYLLVQGSILVNIGDLLEMWTGIILLVNPNYIWRGRGTVEPYNLIFSKKKCLCSTHNITFLIKQMFDIALVITNT